MLDVILISPPVHLNATTLLSFVSLSVLKTKIQTFSHTTLWQFYSVLFLALGIYTP